MSELDSIPLTVMTDSYKAGHPFMYPDATKMVAYGEFRTHFKGIKDDRIVLDGMRYYIKLLLKKKITMKDVRKAEKFFKTHNAGNTDYPFPKQLFEDIVIENNGYWPVKIEMLPDGMVVGPHVPVYQITAEEKWSTLVTFLESILSKIWYPSSVATLSRHAKEIISGFYKTTVDEDSYWTLDSRLHDFGYRGVSSEESALLGGLAHLLNFTGSDTMSAGYYAQFEMNEERPVAQSIAATEHTVMTSWPTELEAIQNMVEKFGGNVFACVMDSYDYENAIYNLVPLVADEVKAKGGFMVLRPDSGDPVKAVLQGLHAAERAFGSTVNSKGYRVLNNCGVIQGDGIDIHDIARILKAVRDDKWAAQNVAFGMGGGLLQKVDRDTMSFATKLSYIEYADGTVRDVMKTPTTDSGKNSLPGELMVCRNPITNVPTTYPKTEGWTDTPNLLEVVYNNGPVDVKYQNFDELKARVEVEWNRLPSTMNCISQDLQEKIDKRLLEAKAPKPTTILA